MDTTKALLVITILICGATGYYAYKTSEDVKHLKEQTRVPAEIRHDAGVHRPLVGIIATPFPFSRFILAGINLIRNFVIVI